MDNSLTQQICFPERTVKTEAPFTRVVALFGLYAFFNTQPTGSAPPLYSMKQILVPIGKLNVFKLRISGG